MKKLEEIKREHILSAGEQIDNEGIPPEFLRNNYWVVLPNGKEYPFKHLTRKAYKIALKEDTSELELDSNEHSRNYIKKWNFEMNRYPERLNFINKWDIEHFDQIGGKPYRKENSEDVRNSNILKTLVTKINYWAKNVEIEGFKSKSDNRWKWTRNFKRYLWITIARKSTIRKVFFIVGVVADDKGGYLFYKIDIQNTPKKGGKEPALSAEKQNMFHEYLKNTDYAEKHIQKDDLEKYDWTKLIEETRTFITKYAAIYDDLEVLLNEDENVEISNNELTETEPPNKTNSYLKEKRKYGGANVDWDRKRKTSKRLGNLGEDLVIRIEKKKLRDAGLEEKADKVQKMLDGNGYDIKSFNEKGEEIHIEVKTTTKSIEKPFYMSINEKCFLEDHPENYFLYRLYNYNFTHNTANFYCMTFDKLKDKNFNPINFEVTI